MTFYFTWVPHISSSEICEGDFLNLQGHWVSHGMSASLSLHSIRVDRSEFLVFWISQHSLSTSNYHQLLCSQPLGGAVREALKATFCIYPRSPHLGWGEFFTPAKSGSALTARPIELLFCPHSPRGLSFGKLCGAMDSSIGLKWSTGISHPLLFYWESGNSWYWAIA